MVSIVMTVYDEPLEMVARQVGKVKSLYPTSDVVLFYDGVPSLPIDGVIHVNPEMHLKTNADAGKWMHLWLSAFLENSSYPYMLKIDPDTKLFGPIQQLPTESAVFGSISRFNVGTVRYFRIHGGGVGYSRSMVETLVERKWFLASEFVNNRRFLDQEDLMLAHVIEREGLRCIDHMEFACGRPVTELTAIAHR